MIGIMAQTRAARHDSIIRRPRNRSRSRPVDTLVLALINARKNFHLANKPQTNYQWPVLNLRLAQKGVLAAQMPFLFRPLYRAMQTQEIGGLDLEGLS
jgi:hypothetical protein